MLNVSMRAFKFHSTLGKTLLGGNNAYGTLLPPALGHLSPFLVGRRCSGWSSHSSAGTATDGAAAAAAARLVPQPAWCTCALNGAK